MKPNMKIILILLSIFFVTEFTICAQETKDKDAENQIEKDIQTARELIQKPLHGYGSILFINGNPQDGCFQELLGNNAYGFSIKGGYYFNPVPITLGLNVDVLFYGGERQMLPRTVLGLKVNDTLETSTTMVPILFHTRFQPQITHFLFPYIELTGGANIYTSTAEIKPYGNPHVSNSQTELFWNYGIGTGLQIRLVDFVELPSTHTALLLDIYARYLFGEEKSLPKANIEDSKTTFVSKLVHTDILSVGIGVTWMF